MLACFGIVERRKQLAMPLIRSLRPPPDPEDPDTTGVAFRPREQAGVKRQRTNNKKTFALMTQLILVYFAAFGAESLKAAGEGPPGAGASGWVGCSVKSVFVLLLRPFDVFGRQ